MEEAKRHPKARARRGRLPPHPCALGRVSGTAQGPLGWGDKGRAGRPSYLAIPSRAPAQPQGRATTRALLLRRVPTPHKSMVRGAGELAPLRENLGDRRGRRGGRTGFPCLLLCPNSRLSPPHSLARTRAHFPRPCPAAARGFRPLRAVQGHAGLRGTSGGCASAAAAAAAPGLRAAGRPAACDLPAASAASAAATRLFAGASDCQSRPKGGGSDGWTHRRRSLEPGLPAAGRTSRAGRMQLRLDRLPGSGIALPAIPPGKTGGAALSEPRRG